MRDWEIDYWDDKKHTIKCYTSSYTWKKVPKKNVIYVRVFRMGVRPYGNPNNVYSMVIKGEDNYFFLKKKKVFIFGGWNDDGRDGTLFYWYPDGKIDKKRIKSRPGFVSDDIIKLGIWVNEPWASRIGLTLPETKVEQGCL